MEALLTTGGSPVQKTCSAILLEDQKRNLEAALKKRSISLDATKNSANSSKMLLNNGKKETEEHREFSDCLHHVYLSGRYWKKKRRKLLQFATGESGAVPRMNTRAASLSELEENEDKADTDATNMAVEVGHENGSDEDYEESSVDSEDCSRPLLSEENEEENETIDTTQSPRSSEGPKLPSRTSEIAGMHVEDSYVYAMKGSLNQSGHWPIPRALEYFPRRRLRSQERNWISYHGDSVDPLVLYDQSTSYLEMLESSLEKGDGSTDTFNYEKMPFRGAIRRDDDSRRKEEKEELSKKAYRSLVLRCWERAIHAASTSFALDDATFGGQRRTTPDGAASRGPTSSETKAILQEWGIVESAADTTPINTNDQGVNAVSGMHNRKADTTNDLGSHSSTSQSSDSTDSQSSDSNTDSMDLSDSRGDEAGFDAVGTFDISYSRMAEKKCCALGIILPKLDATNHEGPIAPLQCPNCGIQQVFDDLTALQNHFYGTEKINESGTTEQHVTGCCWSLVREKKLDTLRGILQKEAKNQASILIRCLLQNCVPSNGAGEVSPGSLNWVHVLDTFYETCEGAHKTDDPFSDHKPQALDTLQTEHGKPPVALNKAIMESTSYRIIERYALE